ncbi:hypothetical protein N7509_005841 [Penicillium cosmopolitanum]|uniref:PCI domain-containing protein n=1 Tax=Penicillium cosmopolitanum TaxID=1131564 RepID=A0A9X0BAG9_9EURO|nr:uncharacterized protein N7509_005841 [Penicillium cosmopolitanum]KAJ5397728.1 hypothetical protein N7509_005841 [Penicillium cosmopolitanum]
MNSSVPWRESRWPAPAPSAAPVPFPTATPACIPVQARRSLAHNKATQPATNGYPPQPAMPSTESDPRPRMEFPPAVRSYVQRCFAPENQVASVDTKEMQEKLRFVITDAAENHKLEMIDWERLALPQVMIQNERNKILANPSVSHWGMSSQPSSPGDASRKRKSTDIHQTENSPPWRKANNNRNRFEDRVTHPSTEKRPRMTTDDSRPVIGRCQKLEKNYFRLTSAPNPDTVRPLPVLRKALDLLKKKWKQESNYTYICDQFKSLRQDLTVQHIRTDFTVTVYEIHARIALEKGDLGEYNQCQTQLRVLYAQSLGGNPTEFKAYRILYFIYTRNWTAMNDALADVTAADKKNEAVKHALDVRSALALGNYHRFFQLYLETPNMGAYLMDMFVDRERLSALAAMCKAYKPDVNIRFITEELGFESDEQTARFVLEHAPAELLEERNGSVRLLTGKAGLVFEQAKSEAHRVVDIKGQI